MTTRIAVASLVLVCVGAVAGLLWDSMSGSNAAADDELMQAAPLPVQVLSIREVTNHQSHRNYTGRVTPRRSSIVSFEVGGKLLNLRVDDGDVVQENQILAEVDTRRLMVQKQKLIAQRDQAKAELLELENGSRDEDIDAAAARVKEHQARLDRLKFQLKRRVDLNRRGVITDDEFEELKFGVQASESSLAAAKEEWEKLVEGPREETITAQRAMVSSLNESIHQIEIDLADSVLKAPFSGTILRRVVDEGTVLTAGQPVLQISESHKLEIRVGLPVEIALNLNSDAHFDVSVRDHHFRATLKSLLPEVHPETRTRTAVLTVPAEDTYKIVSNEIARVEILKNLELQGFWLPTGALTQAGRGLWSCFALVKINDQFVTELRLVEVLHTEESRVLVRGTLNDGDLIISEGAHRITAGHNVIPQ